jgi:hypothetical protein
MKRRHRASLWAYRLLLRAYPPQFRQEYGDEMLRLFRDSLLDGGYQRGLIGVWAHILLDLLITAPQERIAAARASLARRRALSIGANNMVIESTSSIVRQAIRADVENGALLWLGFVAYAPWLLLRNGQLALIPLLALLSLVLLLISARLLLRIQRLRDMPADALAVLSEQPAVLPSSWRRAILIIAVLYLVGVLIVPALVPHNSELHNAMMYSWGLPGRLYYLFGGLVVLATAFLLGPLSIAIIFTICWRWRLLTRATRLIWLLASELLLIALSLPQTWRYTLWWGD